MCLIRGDCTLDTRKDRIPVSNNPTFPCKRTRGYYEFENVTLIKFSYKCFLCIMIINSLYILLLTVNYYLCKITSTIRKFKSI